MATYPVKKPPMAVQSEPRNLEEEIRRRAYELYEEQGRDFKEFTASSGPSTATFPDRAKEIPHQRRLIGALP